MSAATPERRAAEEAMAAPELCRAIASEIEIARAMGLRLESSLCILTAKLGLDAERVRDLQELDLILQHLAALRDLLTMVSAQIDPSLSVSIAEALDRVTLGDVRARLSRTATRAAAIDTGDVEFL
jgi:predicted TIM-barrel fold metal-dependent hydrolase